MNQQPEVKQYHNSKKEEEGKEKKFKKWGKRLWLWSAGPEQRGGLGSGRGQCSGPTGLEKALGVVGGGGLGSRNRRDPGVPPTTVSEGWGPHLGAQQVSWAQVGRANALSSSSAPSRGTFLLAFPDLPGPRGTDPVWPLLLLPPQSPHILLVHLGVPPISLGIRVPHRWPAGALDVGRC